MDAAIYLKPAVEIPAARRCENCGSDDRVKSVKFVRKGDKRKKTSQIRLCLKCRKNHR